MTNHFTSSGGEQNIAIGPGAIGKQERHYHVSGYSISIELFEKYVKELAVTDIALLSFFKILNEQQVPRSDLDSKLREIAATHKELLSRLETVQSEDPQVVRLKGEARQAIEAGDYAKAEELLNQAEDRDVQAIEQLEQAAKQRRISAAASCIENAMLQRIQLRYAKAAEYWQKAAVLMPQESNKQRAYCLGEAGNDLYRIAKYNEAMPLYERSLNISREIDDRVGEGATLNNISQICTARGDYAVALEYLKQSLAICQESGNRAGEGATLNNIGDVLRALGEYTTALPLFEECLTICQEIGERPGEGTALNNIGQIYEMRREYAVAMKYLVQSLRIHREVGNKAMEATTLNNLATTSYGKGDYATGMSYLKQSLAICQEIGDRKQEALTSWNIGYMYMQQGDLSKAEQYISHTVQIEEEIALPTIDESRKILADIRAKLKVQQTPPPQQ